MSPSAGAHRGFAALGLIVVIGGLLMSMVLIMATLSTVPMRMANQHLQSVQARMMATAAIEQLRFDYLSAAEAKVEGTNGLDLSKPPTPPLNLAARFDGNPLFTNPGQIGNGQVVITFDPSQPAWSTDNLASEIPVAGFEDAGTPNTSVPPFCCDIVITVNSLGGPFHYDGVLSQVWPYAVFSLSGMQLTQNTSIQGNVAITAVDPSVAVNGQGPPLYITIGQGGTDSSVATSTVVDGNADILYTRQQVMAALNSGQALPSQVQLQYGGQLTGTEVHQLLPASSPLSGSTAKGGVNIIFPSPSAFTPATFPVVPSLVERAWGSFIGDGHAPPSLSVPPITMPPVRYAKLRVKVAALPTTPIAVNLSPSSINYLTETLTLDGSSGVTQYYVKGSLVNYFATFPVPPMLPLGSRDDPEVMQMADSGGSEYTSLPGCGGGGCGGGGGKGGPPQGGGGKGGPPQGPPQGGGGSGGGPKHHGQCCCCCCNGPGGPPVPNPPSQWKYSGAGLVLKDCVLFIDGDLDLVHGPPGQHEFSVIGDNATLIVNGALRIEQGQLQSSDRGLVILAQGVSLESGGSYNGLLVATQELRIAPQSPTESLTVNGGIFAKGSNLENLIDSGDSNPTFGSPYGYLCGVPAVVGAPTDQPLVVTTTAVNYNPRFTKGLNPIGTLTLKAWRGLP